MITREIRHGHDVIACEVCHDSTVLTGQPEQRADEAAAFEARHHHQTSKLPPSLERAARSKR